MQFSSPQTLPAESTVEYKLLEALRLKDTMLAKSIIEAGQSVDTKFLVKHANQSIAMSACNGCDFKTMKMLIEKGCDLNYLDDDGQSVITLLCHNGCRSILMLLLDSNIDIKLLSHPLDGNFTPAHGAAQAGVIHP